MQDSHELEVVQQLDAMSAELVYHVTEALSPELPPVALSEADQNARCEHRQRIRLTVERFHRLIQIGVTIDWQLVPQEYEWASRVLRSLGVTWDHQNRLIDTYFQEARTRGEWTPDQQAALNRIAFRVQQSGHSVYS